MLKSNARGLAMLIAAGHCIFSTSALAAHPKGPDSAFWRSARESIDHKLTDYTTARFSDVKLAQNDEGYFLCGEVNAKDADGNFGGWIKFSTFGDASKMTTVLATEDTTGPAIVLKGACAWPDTKFLPGEYSSKLTFRPAAR